MSEDVKPFMIIKAKRNLSKVKLQEFKNLYTRQMVEDGLIVIPEDFEIFLIDPKTLERIEIHSLEYEETRQSIWQRLLSKIKGGKR